MTNQTEVEMERGRRIAERAKRHSDLSRYITSGKVVRAERKRFVVGQVNAFFVKGVEIGEENEADDEYPSEVLMAKIALAVGATTGFDDITADTSITEAERARRNVYRDQVRRNLRQATERHGDK